MATGMDRHLSSRLAHAESVDPGRKEILIALVTALLFVLATRWPVARCRRPLSHDEFGFLDQSAAHWFPMHHTLFMTVGRLLGRCRGRSVSGVHRPRHADKRGALASVWWMLRALVRPATAVAAALLLGVGPVFWGYGAMAGNYTAIVLVGAFLLGVAYRGQSQPRPWQPFAAAVALALGTGYRQDIGTLWLAVFRRDPLAASLETGLRREFTLHDTQRGLAGGHALRHRRLGRTIAPRARNMRYQCGYLEFDLAPGLY